MELGLFWFLIFWFFFIIFRHLFLQFVDYVVMNQRYMVEETGVPGE